jgi:hypothetical protein
MQAYGLVEAIMLPRYRPENPPQELLDGVRRRLATVCAEWPEDLFVEVTLRAAWIEYKYDRLMTAGFVVRSRDPRDIEPVRPFHA